MALPALGLLVGGGVVAGITQFLTSRAGMILAAFGLTMIGYKGLQVFLGYAVTDITSAVSLVQSLGGTAGATAGLGAKMIQFAAFAGLFDGINILISGYMAYGSLLGLRVIAARL